MRLALPCAVAAVAVVAAPATPAVAVVDRVQVGVPGKRSATRGFSEGLVVSLASPEPYERGCCTDFVTGTWVGPRIQSSIGSRQQNVSRIDWSVGFARGRRSAAALARDAGWAGYNEIAAQTRRVVHIVGGRRVGMLRGFSVMTAQPAPGARVQAAIAIGLGRRVHAVTLFNLEDPPADSSSDGDLTVQGMPASAWNRVQAAAALDGAKIEGSLPPAKVAARASGGRVRGSVTDGFGHPVAEIALVLQRRVGGRWRRASRGVATRRGTFAFTAPGRASYRVVATLAGTSARSRPVQAGS